METKDEIVIAVLAMMVLIIGLMVLHSVFKISNPDSQSNWASVCGASVVSSVKYSSRMHVISPKNFHCPTKHFYVDDKGVYYNNSLWMSFGKDEKRNKEILEKAIAYDLFSCGRAFSSVDWRNTHYPITFYVVCSDWKFNMTKPLDISDLRDYLNTHTIPQRDETFNSFLTSIACGGACSQKPNNAKTHINTKNGEYAVIFFFGANNQPLPEKIVLFSGLNILSSQSLKTILKNAESMDDALFFLDDSMTGSKYISNLDFVAFLPVSKLR